MMKRNSAVEVALLSSSSASLPLPPPSMSRHSSQFPPISQQLYSLLLLLLITLVSLASISAVSGLSMPIGIDKFDKCANSTYACLSGSNEDGRYNYTIGYCCCYDTWNNCKRTLGCDANGGGNLAAPSASSHPKKVKGSAESCTYLKNQESKMKKEKICPADLTDCPNGTSSLTANWTIMASIFTFLLTVGRLY